MDHNRRMVYRFIDECWNTGMTDLAPELLLAHCRYHDPVFPHMVGGIQSMQHHIERSRRAFPDLRFIIADTIAEGSEVVLHWTLSGTQKGEFLGIPPTNQCALIAGTSIFRIEEGKIAEIWNNWNLLSLMQQLGVKSIPMERAHVGWE